MREFRIGLGDAGDAGEDYGSYPADTPEAAVLACLRDADRTREYETPELLSRHLGYGRGHTGQVNGNGADDRSGWWYVSEADTGVFVGVYAVAERSRDA